MFRILVRGLGCHIKSLLIFEIFRGAARELSGKRAVLSETDDCTSCKSEKWGVKGVSVFARAAVCSLLFLSKLWYMLQVLHCSRVDFQELHRFFCGIYMEVFL